MVSQSDSSSDMELRTFTRQISNLSSTKVTMRTTSQRQDPSGANETNQDTQAGFVKELKSYRPEIPSIYVSPSKIISKTNSKRKDSNDFEFSRKTKKKTLFDQPSTFAVQLSPNRYSALTNNSSQQENPDSRAPKPNALDSRRHHQLHRRI
ncbi:hypothetical protein TNCT_67641 [Trichonephila clavata]|uniref:Uncharacterized protein n=1 Tax=Trichonephila clavata TaxID=2740835 RepID=A0A8X6ILY2_TRICU|nr:hypothetical protein TNCT_67641 [Trichonephila clavata]